jgi:hypothetical protein
MNRFGFEFEVRGTFICLNIYDLSFYLSMKSVIGIQ